MRYVNSKVGIKPDSVKVLLTAPTGKAAFNTRSMIHSAFALPVTEFGGEMPKLSCDVCNTLRTHLLDLKLIIINEISMVGSRILSRVNTCLKQIFDTPVDFGGISIICVGDFHQLRPVKDSYVFQVPSSGKETYEQLVGPYLWDKFSFVELTEIMRQKDDMEFARALNSLANGILTEDDCDLFKSRQIKKENLDNVVSKNAIHLFCTNASVDSHNIIVLDSLSTEGIKSIALDNLVGDHTGKMTECLSNTIRSLK